MLLPAHTAVRVMSLYCQNELLLTNYSRTGLVWLSDLSDIGAVVYQCQLLAQACSSIGDVSNQNGKMELSEFQNVFVHIDKYICSNLDWNLCIIQTLNLVKTIADTTLINLASPYGRKHSLNSAGKTCHKKTRSCGDHHGHHRGDYHWWYSQCWWPDSN